MPRARWDRPRAFDHRLLLCVADDALARAARARLSAAAGRRPEEEGGRYPRFRVVVARKREDARRRVAAGATAAAVDLSGRGGSGLDVVRDLREARPDLPILAFARAAPTSDAIAAVMAGADFFHDCADACEGLERALELAIDRRRLALLIERSEEEAEAARGKLAQLSAHLVQAVPGFRPLHAREDVIPFREAARRYLLAAAQLFAGDARGLAKALGVSYFALRRLLARYAVPFPGARARR